MSRTDLLENVTAPAEAADIETLVSEIVSHASTIRSYRFSNKFKNATLPRSLDDVLAQLSEAATNMASLPLDLAKTELSRLGAFTKALVAALPELQYGNTVEKEFSLDPKSIENWKTYNQRLQKLGSEIDSIKRLNLTIKKTPKHFEPILQLRFLVLQKLKKDFEEYVDTNNYIKFTVLVKEIKFIDELLEVFSNLLLADPAIGASSATTYKANFFTAVQKSYLNLWLGIDPDNKALLTTTQALLVAQIEEIEAKLPTNSRHRQLAPLLEQLTQELKEFRYQLTKELSTTTEVENIKNALQAIADILEHSWLKLEAQWDPETYFDLPRCIQNKLRELPAYELIYSLDIFHTKYLELKEAFKKLQEKISQTPGSPLQPIYLLLIENLAAVISKYQAADSLEVAESIHTEHFCFGIDLLTARVDEIDSNSISKDFSFSPEEIEDCSIKNIERLITRLEHHVALQPYTELKKTFKKLQEKISQNPDSLLQPLYLLLTSNLIAVISKYQSADSPATAESIYSKQFCSGIAPLITRVYDLDNKPISADFNFSSDELNDCSIENIERLITQLENHARNTRAFLLATTGVFRRSAIKPLETANIEPTDGITYSPSSATKSSS